MSGKERRLGTLQNQALRHVADAFKRVNTETLEAETYTCPSHVHMNKLRDQATLGKSTAEHNRSHPPLSRHQESNTPQYFYSHPNKRPRRNSAIPQKSMELQTSMQLQHKGLICLTRQQRCVTVFRKPKAPLRSRRWPTLDLCIFEPRFGKVMLAV